MDEHITKSKQIETNIVRDIRQNRLNTESKKRDVFSAYDPEEQKRQLARMQSVAIRVQHEDALIHGYTSEYSIPVSEKAAERTHAQVEDEYAGLSWSQKRKVAKRQKKALKEAKRGGIQDATELTQPLSAEKTAAEEAWNEREKTLTAQEREALRTKRPEADLFDRHYTKGGSQPYDIARMTARLKELELVERDMQAYRQRLQEDPSAEDWKMEAEYMAQEELRNSLGKAVEALYDANAVTRREQPHQYLTVNDYAINRQELLKKCVEDYQRMAENYDLVVFRCQQQLSTAKLQKHLKDTPGNEADEQDFGFSFLQRPAELDALRALMNAPENAQRVLDNKEVIAVIWREYIRLSRTIDEKQAEIQLQTEKGGVEFAQLKAANASEVFRFEGLRDAYATILRHFTAGEELDTYTDALLKDLTGVHIHTYTEYRLKTDKLYQGVYTNERSETVRKAFIDRAAQINQSIFKYFVSLPADQINDKMDPRMLLCLCDGWQTDMNGQPLTEKDREIMERETKWVRDLYGNNAEERHAIIDQEIELYTQTDLPKNLLSDEFILQDPVGLRKFVYRYLLLDNFISGDPEYYQSLPPQTRAKIDFMSNVAVMLATYLTHKQVLKTGVDEKYEYLKATDKETCEMIAAALEPELRKSLQNLDKRMKAYVFDTTTDTFTVEEQPSADTAFNVMRSPRFLTKLQNRAKKGLPCDDLGQIFDIMGGKTLAEYYESIISPQYTEEQKQEMRHSGFAGRTVNIDGVDFGTDDLMHCVDVIQKLTEGGSDALEYGVDEITAQELKQYYDVFCEEAYANANLRIIYANLVGFGGEFSFGLQQLKGHESEFPALVDSMSRYRSIALPKLEEVEQAMVATDQKLRAELFIDIISVMERNNVCFEVEHRAPLKAYMDDPATAPVIEHSVSCMLDGAELKLYGEQGGLPQISAETLERKREALGDGFGAWAQELTQLVTQANEQFVRDRKSVV